MTEPSSITLKIFGEDYSIRSQDDPLYVQKVAAYLDEKMREVASATNIVSSSKIAILAALNITDEYFRLKESDREQEETLNRVLGELIKILDQHLE